MFLQKFITPVNPKTSGKSTPRAVTTARVLTSKECLDIIKEKQMKKKAKKEEKQRRKREREEKKRKVQQKAQKVAERAEKAKKNQRRQGKKIQGEVMSSPLRPSTFTDTCDINQSIKIY